MSAVRLAGFLALASRCCNAFNVDHYDEHRRLRRVQYNPWVKAPEVSVHYNTPSGRRLDWHDETGPGSDGYEPFSSTPDVTLMVVNPDELYIHTTDTAITIYGTDVTLDEYMFNVDKDLSVVAGRIRLPSTLRLNSKPAWTGELRTLLLHAMEMVVPDTGATIDLSGSPGITADHGMPASHGINPGDSGSDGQDGGAGGSGGVVEIQVAELLGGLLSVNVDGGVGGDGQAGGDGAVGAVGERRTDIDDCCSAKTGQTGNPGGPGGDAGLGGNGGQGGTAGYANVQISKPFDESSTNLPIQNLFIQAQPGAGGAAGLPGRNGPGGAGGPGIMTKCVRIDIWWFNRMCTFPLGDNGEVGPDGATATAGAPGKMGPMSASGVSTTGEKSLYDLRANAFGDHLRYELFLADKLYRSASYVEAQKLYVWIESVLHSNHTETVSTPWKQIGLDAAVKLSQLKSGLDFWGRQLNHAPLVSFQALHDNIVNLLSIAKDAEDAYDVYYADGTSEIERKNLITKAMKNLDYEIAVTEAGLVETKDAILTLRTDILALQEEQDMWTQLVMSHAEDCDAGIAAYEASINSGFQASVRKLTTLATNGIALWGTVAAIATVGLGIWTLMATSVPAVVDSVVKTATNSGGNIQNVLQTGLTDVVPGLQTLVTDTQTGRADITDAWGSVSGAVTTITDDLASDKTRVDGIRTQTNVAISMEDFLSIRTEYIDTIPECAPVRDDYTHLRDASLNLQSKVTEHDMNVVNFASLTVQRSTLQQEREDLLNSVVGTFDPTSLQFMQSIGQAYRAQKDRIVEMLKMLHDAVDFEFCEQNPFQYEDVRVAQLSSFLAQISTDRMRRLAEDQSSRGILEARGSNHQATAVTKITLTPTASNDLAAAFNSFWVNGTLTYSLDMDNAALPAGVANLRVVNAQAFVPALLLDEFGTSDMAEVWMRKLGSSTCTNSAGKQQIFSHAANSYYSVYSAKVDPRLTAESPTWLTQPTPPIEGNAGPTPVGTWQISVPSLTTAAQREQVQEVEIHLILSYVPCSSPSCGSTSAAAASALSLHSKHQMKGHSVTFLSTCGAAALGSLLTIAAVFGINTRRAALRATLASPRADESELRETQ